MAIAGTLEYMNESYVLLETSFTKGSRQLILVAEQDLFQEGLDLNRIKERYYREGGLLNENYLLGMLDPVRKMQYGSIELLNLVYEAINEVVRNAKMARTMEHKSGKDTYHHDGSYVIMSGSQYHSYSIRTSTIKVEASFVSKLNVKPRALGKKLASIKAGGGTKYDTATFVDASMEYLERVGFDTGWVEEKEYIEVHTLEDWDKKVIPAFIQEYKRWKREQDFKYFLVSGDFESTGLFAFSPIHPKQDKSVFFSISFKDNQSFGVFIDMENFSNVDTQGIAERFTYMFQIDPLVDRDLVFHDGPEVLRIKRSDIKTTAHNAMIDRRFGMTIGADMWFDIDTLQVSFNLDPFMTKGKNGLKDIVNKFFGVEYAELGDICGKKNKGMFKYLSDIRVIMMYGCADTDWHRLAAKRLISICEEAKDYYGVDHVEQHMRLDTLYMNHKADCDFNGMRIDFEGFRKNYEERTRILNLYYSFMAQYVGRVKSYNDYEKLVLNAERYGVELETIGPRDIDRSPEYHVTKWSGQELLDVLFKVLDYPILAYTTQNKKAKMAGRAFKPKPAINTDALKHYMKLEASVDLERIDQAFESTTSLEDLKWYSMYLKNDFVDPVTGKVLISKKKFNSFRLPFTYVLLLISPIVKEISAELKPVVENNSEYKFTTCNMASAVTRRDLNPTQTVSGDSKYYYKPYTDDYNFGTVDQSAVEIRILYGLSKDESLIKPLDNPEKDSHTETAALMHQKPAHTISKKVRKGIKFLAFGRPYGKEVFSSCRDFYGDNSPEHMAEMAYLFELYDNKLSSVMEVLNKVRDAMDEPVNPPQSLKDYLEFDPEKKYGRMINEFGFCQHLEIRPEEWFRQSLRRKAGNFIIQGFAANLLRIIYVRLLKAFWAKGWIQDRRVMIHLTVHDEVDFSYHKSLNPVEVMAILHEALTVKMAGFPTFYVGINFGNNWGQAKADESELPVHLVNEMNKELKEGVYDNYDFGDHIDFFAKKRIDYQERRLARELKTVNQNKNVWKLEYINEAFTNYAVRSLLPDLVGYKNALIHIPKDSEEPILGIAAFLPHFIFNYMMKTDDRNHYISYKGKHVKLTEETISRRYQTVEDFMDGKFIEEEGVVQEELVMELDDLEVDIETELEDMGFDFDDVPLDEEEYATDGIQDLNSGFLNSYHSFKLEEDTFKEYGSINARVNAEAEEAAKKIPKFENFKITNGSIVLPIAQLKHFTMVRKFCVGKTTASTDGIKLYLSSATGLTKMHSYDVDFLHKLDEYLTEILSSSRGVRV